MRASIIVLLVLFACPSMGLAKPKQGEACDADGKCAHGLTCVRYYGVAGARGPEMTSCEIRCGKGKKHHCPKDQTCVTIADGPGQVCRATASTPPQPTTAQ